VAVDYFEAWWTGLADVVDYSWSERLMDEWKIPRDWLGEIHLPQEIIGEVTEQAAAMTGLAMGTPVVCGSGDGLCNVIGTGLLESGITMDSAGVTEIIASISKSPLAPSVGESFTSWRHPNSQDWVLYTSTSSAGLSLRWFKDQVAQLERSDSPIQGSDYERLDKEAEEADAGSGRLLFLPYLTGEYSPFFDLNARGAFLGISLETQRRHLTRAVLEGVAFSLRHVLEYFEGLGVETHSIRSSGGGSRSKLWNQIKADVTGKPISTLEIVESGCLGAAVLAGVAVGQYRNLEAATKAMVRIGDTLFPNEANHTMYSKQFQIYKESYTKLKETFAKLADL
jgi:xylulokinase